jgi:hypothetical protein
MAVRDLLLPEVVDEGLMQLRFTLTKDGSSALFASRVFLGKT